VPTSAGRQRISSLEETVCSIGLCVLSIYDLNLSDFRSLPFCFAAQFFEAIDTRVKIVVWFVQKLSYAMTVRITISIHTQSEHPNVFFTNSF
jgi:hypothetical protein